MGRDTLDQVAPVPGPHPPHRGEFLPHIPSHPALWQWEAIPSCPDTPGSCPKSFSMVSVSPDPSQEVLVHQMYTSTDVPDGPLVHGEGGQRTPTEGLDTSWMFPLVALSALPLAIQ